MSPQSPSDPVSFRGWRTEAPSPAQALRGTCSLYLFGACLDGGRGDFCLSCQSEEVWMEQWSSLSRRRLRASSFGCSHLLGSKETGVQQGWWV